MKAYRLFCVSILLVFSSLATTAQIAADLQGRVLDSSGAAIANASITLTETATNVHQQTTTSAPAIISSPISIQAYIAST